MANSKTAYHRERAAILRDKLVRRLGGCCVQCESIDELQFDHIDPRTRTWVARRCSQWGRMRRYWNEALQGLIQLLCKSCNRKKNARVEDVA